MAEQFTHDEAPTHSEGLVVKFIPNAGPEWFANFQFGNSAVSRVGVHPNGRDALIVARGQGYVVSVPDRELVSTFGGYITDIVDVPGEPIVIFADSGVAFEALSENGLLWRTKRISYDGFRNLRIAAAKLPGEAWSPVDDRWFAFEVNLKTGQHRGGHGA